MLMFSLFMLVVGVVVAPTTQARRAVSVPEAAKMLGISVTSAWKLVYAGDIRAVRLGRSVRVTLTEIDRLLEGARDANDR